MINNENMSEDQNQYKGVIYEDQRKQGTCETKVGM